MMDKGKFHCTTAFRRGERGETGNDMTAAHMSRTMQRTDGSGEREAIRRKRRISGSGVGGWRGRWMRGYGADSAGRG